jgi:hypothetical protein
MSKNAAFLVIALMMTVSLSGCVGRGGGNGENDKNMGSPEEVNAEEYNVLYIGHSFGRVFAETLQDYAHTAGFTDHAQYIESSGGTSGAPDALWEDDGHRENIKAYLDTGEIDVFIMICCSIEFMESDFESDAAIWNFTSYAVDQNPNWFGHAMEGFPWRVRKCKRVRSELNTRPLAVLGKPLTGPQFRLPKQRDIHLSPRCSSLRTA